MFAVGRSFHRDNETITRSRVDPKCFIPDHAEQSSRIFPVVPNLLLSSQQTIASERFNLDEQSCLRSEDGLLRSSSSSGEASTFLFVSLQREGAPPGRRSNQTKIIAAERGRGWNYQSGAAFLGRRRSEEAAPLPPREPPATIPATPENNAGG